MTRVLIGGTFDPPHQGHVALARAASRALGTDGGVFLPAAQNPLKGEHPQATAAHRVRMVELAAKAAGLGHWEIRTDEAYRSGPSYLVDTLEQWERQHGPEPWVFCMGAEVAQSLPRWKSPQRLLELIRVGVVGRQGVAETLDTAALAATLGCSPERFVPIQMPPCPFSSTQLRASLGSLPPEAWALQACPVPGISQPVWDYIRTESLYRPTE